MPIRVPKKIPPWVDKFSEFAKSKEKKQNVQQCVDMHSELVKKHWEEFSSKLADETSSKPAKKRNIDPIKTMGKAMNKVAEQVEEAKDNRELLRQYKERMKDVVPDQIKPVLSDVMGDHTTMSASPDDLNRLIQQTTENLDVLNQTTQKVLSYANIDRKDAELTIQSLHQVSLNIEELKDSLNP